MTRVCLVVPVLAGVFACQPAAPQGEEGGESGGESSGAPAGSSEGGEASSSAPVDDDARYTYYRDVKPIVDARCASCHRPGTIAPFSLQTADEVVTLAPALRGALERGTMPPWPPSAECNSYAHDGSLPADQRDVVLAWIDDGGPLGDPSDEPPAPPKDDEIVWDAELVMPEAYQTSPTAADDYRCFVLDWPLDAPKYVTGFEAVPDQPSIVHHVIAFVIPPGEAQTYRDMDAAEDGPGYTCFGGPGGGFKQQWLGAWAPGTRPSSDADRGILVQPGSAVVLQMHYHPTPEPPADRSKIRVTLSDEVRYEQYVLPFTDPDWVGGAGMMIPAGEKGVVHRFDIDLIPFLGQVFPDAPLVAGEPFLMHTVSLHMHTRGTRASLTVERKDGSSECGLYIPRWDFNWQGGYKLDRPITVNPGDKLSLTCEWDNTAENQPIVDGQPMPAKNVYWGEGTGDEMCLAVLTVSSL